MKVLHAAAFFNPPSGIVDQMISENDAAKNLGLDWSVKIYTSKDTCNHTIFEHIMVGDTKNYLGFTSKFVRWVKFNLDYYRNLQGEQSEYEVILLRHAVFNPFQIYFIYRAKCQVYLVHHTLEVLELKATKGLIWKFMAIFEAFFGKHSIRLAHGIVGVTREIILYEKIRAKQINKLSFIYPNGIRVLSPVVDDNRKGIPEFVFVASYFYYWHGVDLLIDAVSKSNENFVIHLIGDLEEKDKVSALKDSRIKVHGALDGFHIRKIFSKCWAGLSSFALHRKHMKEACTLKVREYLMSGLPVYSGHVDVFPDEFTCYKFGRCNIYEIIKYGYLFRSVKREHVSRMAGQYIDKESILRDLYTGISEQNKSDD